MLAIVLFSFALLALTRASLAAAPIVVDVAGVEPNSDVRVDVGQPDRVIVQWPTGNETTGAVTFRLSKELATDSPLIESMSLRRSDEPAPQIVGKNLAPFTAITVGTRNLDTPGGWTIFFDKVHQRPYVRHGGSLELSTARATARGTRGSIAFGRFTAGPFSGELVFSFYAGSPLILAEAVVSTSEDRTAFVYDAGLVAQPGGVKRFTWLDYDDAEKSQEAAPSAPAGPRAVRHRAVVAEMADAGCSVAVFPPPHRFFYPLDFAENFGFNWLGRDYPSAPAGDGWGIRQPPEGDRRFTPWVNAPPGTKQRLGAFYLLSADGATAALKTVQRYTHADRYVTLPNYKTFTSHYHIEHTLDLLDQQKKSGTNDVPATLLAPEFVKTFRDTGVDIVHLAEFHNGQTPKLETAERLRQLRALHAECGRLSDDKFLLLPGEEPNVHLGGHWISLFPRPVLWVLNRPAGTPFMEKNPAGETVYHVGSQDDVLTLMQREHGLMWTAHARIKSSVGFPDAYRDKEFFKSPHFLGAAWKAMPADYSRDTLGWRVLDLLDEMNLWSGPTWNTPKQALGEVDVFKIQRGYEFYGHANVNYVQMANLPRFADGWAPLVEALRAGRFFTTTGETLITDVAITRSPGQPSMLRAHLEWTFPLHHAELVGGDGDKIHRHRLDLSDTKEHGERDVQVTLPEQMAKCQWVRLEVWDVAINGAFTQPIRNPE